jgi:hypothetical protein
LAKIHWRNLIFQKYGILNQYKIILYPYKISKMFLNWCITFLNPFICRHFPIEVCFRVENESGNLKAKARFSLQWCWSLFIQVIAQEIVQNFKWKIVSYWRLKASFGFSILEEDRVLQESKSVTIELFVIISLTLVYQTIEIFLESRIGFVIQRGLVAQLVVRLPSIQV